jgi:hypothetical protein
VISLHYRSSPILNFRFQLVYEYKLACKCCTDVSDLVKLVYVTTEDDNGSAADQWVEICDPATYRM